MSAAMKGKVPWNKGRTGVYSDETIARKSAAQQAALYSGYHNLL